MSFANHNILDIALSIIPPTVVQIRKNLGTAVNKYGQSTASYSDWIEVYGIVQPGGEQNEHTQGIDFSKKHVTIWLRGVALDGTHIQWAPDQIRFVGRIFNVVGVKDWYPYDNYRECECVEALNLGENQKAANSTMLSPQKRKPTTRKSKKTRAETSQQPSLQIEPTPQEILPMTGEPVLFKADAASVPEEEISPTPKKKPVVGKAIIRF